MGVFVSVWTKKEAIVETWQIVFSTVISIKKIPSSVKAFFKRWKSSIKTISLQKHFFVPTDIYINSCFNMSTMPIYFCPSPKLWPLQRGLNLLFLLAFLSSYLSLQCRISLLCCRCLNFSVNKKGKLRAKATNCFVWLFVYSRVYVFWQNEVIFLQLFCSLKW